MFLTQFQFLLLLKRVAAEGREGLERMIFSIPWNCVKEQVLHNLTKYFSET